MKTNKSYTKRLRATRNGILVARKPGQNHFNAKESRGKQLSKARMTSFYMKPKSRGRFMPGN